MTSSSDIVSMFAFALSLVSLIVAVRAARSAASATISGSFNELIRLGLGSDDATDSLDRFFYPELAEQPIASKRERLFAHHVLNIIEHAYIGKRHWTVDSSVAGPLLEDYLPKLMLTSVARHALQTGNYDRRFQEYAMQFAPAAPTTNPATAPSP